MELVQRIAVQLDEDDDAMFSLRLTCKALEVATFDRFANRFFKSREYSVLSKRSMLRLQDLLARSSQMMARMQHITFVSAIFPNRSHKQVSLALKQSQTNLQEAQMAAMQVCAASELKALHNQSLPDAELIRCVLIAFKEKCPHAQLSLDLRRHVRSSMPVHADVLEVVSSLDFALTSLKADLDHLCLREPGTLIPRLSTCMPSLHVLSFAKAEASRSEADRPVIERQTLAAERYSLLRNVLDSANGLRELTLDFRAHKMDLQSNLQLTSVLLVAGSHPKLESLRLESLAITQEALFEALTIWRKRLKKVQLSMVCLTDVKGDNWLDVLKTLTKMPKLRKVKLHDLYGLRGRGFRYHVDLRHLTQGLIRNSPIHGGAKHKSVAFRNRKEVKAGLNELLVGGLRYLI